MKTTIGKSLLSTASAAAILTAFAFATPASAGDWNNGASGLKGSYASKITAVPAPAPIPEFDAKYYIGINATYTAASSGTITQDGDYVDLKEMSDTSGFLNAGFTLGRYITPSLRAELAFDFRPLRGITSTDSRYSDFQVGESGQDAHRYAVERTDVKEYQYQTGMVNIIHDFKNQSRFTPFIGVGVGAVLYTFKQDSSETSSCEQSYVRALDGIRWVGETIEGTPICNNAPERDPTSNSGTSNSWGLAVAGTAGVAVDVTESMKFDVGYRALYTSGTVELSEIVSNGNTSTIKIEDRLDHEIRLGLRWDIN